MIARIGDITQNALQQISWKASYDAIQAERFAKQFKQSGAIPGVPSAPPIQQAPIFQQGPGSPGGDAGGIPTPVLIGAGVFALAAGALVVLKLKKKKR